MVWICFNAFEHKCHGRRIFIADKTVRECFFFYWKLTYNISLLVFIKGKRQLVFYFRRNLHQICKEKFIQVRVCCWLKQWKFFIVWANFFWIKSHNLPFQFYCCQAQSDAEKYIPRSTIFLLHSMRASQCEESNCSEPLIFILSAI